MPIFEKVTPLAATADQVYRYHCHPGAFGRLCPPWEKVQVREKDEGIKEGDIRHLKVGPPPIQLPWVALHEGFQEGRQFVDRQTSGPFRKWVHTHSFEPQDGDTCLLRDHIEYAAPLNLPLGPLFQKKLTPMFRFRHRQTERDLRLLLAHPSPLRDASNQALKVAITGSSGLLGRSLTSFLQVAGHRVIQLKRGHQAPGGDAALWWPEPDQEALEGLDAVVHLAGETVGQLWTKAVRERVFFSRSEGTKRLSRALADLKSPPKVLISTSATGYYEQKLESNGPVDESATPGDDFLAEVCQAWEEGTAPAEEAGIRVCHLRIGLVVSGRGGFMSPQFPAFKMGLGAVLGQGTQMQPVIDIDDVIGSIYHLLQKEELSGAFNATCPNPLTQAEFAQDLARACSRPLWMKVPEAPLRFVLRDQADLLFRGVQAVPKRLLESGYEFLSPTFEDSLKHQMGLP